MSDQDFFFDEDETPAEKPAAKSASGRKDSTPAPAVRQKAMTTVSASRTQTVTMTVAALIAVVALLVGVIIGILIPTGGAQPVPSPVTAPAPGTGVARPLAPEELEGDLPAGHPDIGGMTGGAVTPTGTTEPDSTE